MITTGVRTPVGIKVMGPDLSTIEKVGLELEEVLKEVEGTHSAFFERVTGGYYLDVVVNRDEAARYGLTSGDVNDMVEVAIGGMSLTGMSFLAFPGWLRHTPDAGRPATGRHHHADPKRRHEADGTHDHGSFSSRSLADGLPRVLRRGRVEFTVRAEPLFRGRFLEYVPRHLPSPRTALEVKFAARGRCLDRHAHRVGRPAPA